MSPGLVELAPGVRRLLAPNPSLMTGPGTNTYLVGSEDIAVIDPGPVIPSHLDTLAQLPGTVRWILATHTHPDHSPGIARLAELTGAEVLGMPPPATDHQDMSFRPTRVLADGDELRLPDFTIEAVHTPGHASNHLCYRLQEINWILTGDHIIAGSTVVINPPDGNMREYLCSLQRVRELRPDALLPGHGGRIDNAAELIDSIVAHRLRREEKVLAAVRLAPDLDAKALVPVVYTDVDPALFGWAERSLLAHLIKLTEDGVLDEQDGRYRLRPDA